MQETTNIHQNQLSQANQALLLLADNITCEDRAAATKNGLGNRITISKYLQGKGSNLDTSTKLLKFFKKCIIERDKLIKAA